MGLLTFSFNVTLDGCVDHQEGVADDETHAFVTTDPKAMASRPRNSLAGHGIEITHSTALELAGMPLYQQVSREGCVLPGGA